MKNDTAYSGKKTSVRHGRVGFPAAVLLILIIALMLLLGCSPESKEELYGTYIADYEIARERLILYDDGTFFQEITRKDTLRTDTSSGTWSYENVNGEMDIHFHENFIAVLNGFNRLDPNYIEKPIHCYLEPWKIFGQIRIEFNEGMWYVKVNDADGDTLK